MNWRMLGLAAMTSALTFSATAEPLPVQSGEHAAFSRLVTLVRDAEWTIQQTGRELVLTLPKHNDSFDVSTVFDRMPRSRIENVEATAGALRLTLSCDCAVSAFLEKEAYVVIDVAQDPAFLESPAIEPTPVTLLTEAGPELEQIAGDGVHTDLRTDG